MTWCHSAETFSPASEYGIAAPGGRLWQLPDPKSIPRKGGDTLKQPSRRCCIWGESFFPCRESFCQNFSNATGKQICKCHSQGKFDGKRAGSPCYWLSRCTDTRCFRFCIAGSSKPGQERVFPSRWIIWISAGMTITSGATFKLGDLQLLWTEYKNTCFLSHSSSGILNDSTSLAMDTHRPTFLQVLYYSHRSWSLE